jgi:hypothetical protein
MATKTNNFGARRKGKVYVQHSAPVDLRRMATALAAPNNKCSKKNNASALERALLAPHPDDACQSTHPRHAPLRAFRQRAGPKLAALKDAKEFSECVEDAFVVDGAMPDADDDVFFDAASDGDVFFDAASGRRQRRQRRRLLRQQRRRRRGRRRHGRALFFFFFLYAF